jgi:hypothetical protein
LFASERTSFASERTSFASERTSFASEKTSFFASMERLACGCLPSGAFEQQIVKAQREYKAIHVVKHFNRCCDSCHTRNPHLCDIQTDLSIEDVRLAHGISLQRSYKLMKELTDDDYLLEPLKKAVRYAEHNTPENITEFAHKLSLILNALAQVHSNGSVVRIIGLGGVLVLSLQGFIAGA